MASAKRKLLENPRWCAGSTHVLCVLEVRGMLAVCFSGAKHIRKPSRDLARIVRHFYSISLSQLFWTNQFFFTACFLDTMRPKPYTIFAVMTVRTTLRGTRKHCRLELVYDHLWVFGHHMWAIVPHYFTTWDVGSGKSVYREDPEPIAGY